MNYKMYPTLVLQVTYNSSETPSSVCGLIVSTKVSGSQECYVFVPPFEYDRENSWHIWAMEKLLSVVKTASRSSIYYSMRNKMQDLTKVAETIKSGTTREVTAYHCEGVTMEQDYNEQRCEFEIHFDPEDQLTKVRLDEQRSDKLITLALGTETTHACTFMQVAPPSQLPL